MHARVLRRRLGPVINWAPAHDPYHVIASMRPGAAGIPPLHATQRALLKLSAQMNQRGVVLPFGLLCASLCRSPEMRTNYLLLDEVMAARRELTAEEPLQQLRTELRALASDAERRRKLTLGWYLGGMDGDLELDPEAAALHRELFPEAWHVAVVDGQQSGTQQGAFLRFESVTERFYAIAFSELLPEGDSGREGAEPRTAVRWTNYRSTQPVTPLDDAAIAELTRGESRGRELDLGSFMRFLRRGAEPAPMGGASPPADAPAPPAAPPPATSPPRRLDGRPIPTSAPTPPVRRAAAAPAAKPAPGPSPVVPEARPEQAPAPLVPEAKPMQEPAPAVRDPKVMPAPASPASEQKLTPAPPAPAQKLMPAPPAPEQRPVRLPAPSVSSSMPLAEPAVAPVPPPPIVSSEPAAPDVEVPRVFIDGALVPLPEDGTAIPGHPPTDSSAPRFLLALLFAALIVLVALAVYLSGL